MSGRIEAARSYQPTASRAAPYGVAGIADANPIGRMHLTKPRKVERETGIEPATCSLEGRDV